MQESGLPFGCSPSPHAFGVGISMRKLVPSVALSRCSLPSTGLYSLPAEVPLRYVPAGNALRSSVPDQPIERLLSPLAVRDAFGRTGLAEMFSVPSSVLASLPHSRSYSS